jgi:hypothetical protein
MDLFRLPVRAFGGMARPRPARRRCILHVGSPKTATSSVQSMLKRNRRRFLKDGILVPRSGQTASGSHRYLAYDLAGLSVPREGEAADQNLGRELARSEAETVLISSEFLWSILTRHEAAERLLARLRSLDLDVTVLLYVRNQPQYFNSIYQHDANFRRRRTFSTFLRGARRNEARYGYSRWLDFARAHDLPLLIRPFSAEVREAGVVEDFLTAVGVSNAGGYDTTVELRRSVGPFTVAVAQSLMGRIDDPTRLSEQQTSDCRHALRAELRRRHIVDHGYCGLTSRLAAEIEEAFQEDNARFSRTAWGKPWHEVFATDVAQDFEPNDYAVAGIPHDRRELLGEVLDSLGPKVDEIVKGAPGTSGRTARWTLSSLKARLPL